MLTPAEFRELKNFYRALADVNRIRIVQLLVSDGELVVSDLVRRLRLSQPLVSWHLHRLKRAGLVTTERVGREVRCRFDRDRFAQLSDRGTRLVMNRAGTPFIGSR